MILWISPTEILQECVSQIHYFIHLLIVLKVKKQNMIQRNTQSENTIKEFFFFTQAFFPVFFTVLWSPFCVNTSSHFADVSPLIFILLAVLLPFLFHSPFLVLRNLPACPLQFPIAVQSCPFSPASVPAPPLSPVPLSLASSLSPVLFPSALHPPVPLFPSLSLI